MFSTTWNVLREEKILANLLLEDFQHATGNKCPGAFLTVSRASPAPLLPVQVLSLTPFQTTKQPLPIPFHAPSHHFRSQSLAHCCHSGRVHLAEP